MGLNHAGLAGWTAEIRGPDALAGPTETAPLYLGLPNRRESVGKHRIVEAAVDSRAHPRILSVDDKGQVQA